MNIVILSPESVYPANTGGRIVVFNKIKYLSYLNHNIYLFCIVDSIDEVEYQRKEISKYCIQSWYYNRSENLFEKIKYTLMYPYAVGSRTMGELVDDLNDLMKKECIDVIVSEMPQMSVNVMKANIKANTRLVLSMHNIESASMMSMTKSINSPLKRFIYRFDSFRFRKFEDRLIRKQIFDAYTFVSKDDIGIFSRRYQVNPDQVYLVPIGAEEHEGEDLNSTRNDIIIVGKMSYLPNVEGVLWFYDKVWQRVKSSEKDSKLIIVGKDPDERIKDINDNSVIVTGTVETVEPYYLNAAAAVIPIFSGGGVKTKLIEASSYGIPIICTKLGALGTEFQDGVHAVITDNESEFTKGVVDALRGEQNTRIMAQNAKNLFERKYRWKAIIDDFDEDLRIITGR